MRRERGRSEDEVRKPDDRDGHGRQGRGFPGIKWSGAYAQTARTLTRAVQGSEGARSPVGFSMWLSSTFSPDWAGRSGCKPTYSLQYCVCAAEEVSAACLSSRMG